ncbi:leucine-rich colipase-like protein 1 isoform X1 [Mus musculus]|uniref:Leucine-rich colipase-like protein 1 n=2 Tax=Mus musculus TaxID=10090 RepID=LRCL1_MOUSE|nr:leucine-rich colipase-like protein 1 precursor [Mus musculus]XP_006535095.1 leucine-rich colipase-like protein 1 isoform X1 [Mus musculus]Q3URS3.2 RecName: Full=Leucine-rich colipase-like protein 1; AltName: Full=Colipase-like protein 3; Flags: Precursor [Mus musculus]AFE85885.1 colipase-like protein 3 variant 1 [Mus musculus]|eukprot:NP_001297638.1 leucine-rich colipase-like protein 1 precursor [Mus musculus]
MSVSVWPPLLLLLLLLLLWAVPTFQDKNTRVSAYKGIGEMCRNNSECQSDCCVTNSLNPQKFCTSQTVFLECVPWRKPNGFLCEENTECHSNCCIRTSSNPDRFCSSKTIFMQCISWRKPEGAICQHHLECWDLCCLPLSENSPSSHCTKRTGLLALCLPV